MKRFWERKPPRTLQERVEKEDQATKSRLYGKEFAMALTRKAVDVENEY